MDVFLGKSLKDKVATGLTLSRFLDNVHLSNSALVFYWISVSKTFVRIYLLI